MTLCMAAVCHEQGAFRIASLADTRVEGGWAGANTGYKYAEIATPGWRAMLAGDSSKARDLVATCKSVLKPEQFTYDNIFDKINEASAAHKEKLCRRLVQSRLGISFDRFLDKGERELTPEVRNRVLYEIEELDFGCSIIIFGFIGSHPRIYIIDKDGEVQRRENFAAIGSGYVVAQSILYYREQAQVNYVERTLYNLYEAFALTYEAKAPGVGGAPQAAVHEPREGGEMAARLLMSKGIAVLASHFKKYGPKPVKTPPQLEAKHFVSDDDAKRVLDTLIERKMGV